jgi:hypothetical protein
MSAGRRRPASGGAGRDDRGSRPAPASSAPSLSSSAAPDAQPGALSAAPRTQPCPLSAAPSSPVGPWLTVAGARGGQGTSTVAALAALILAQHTSVTLLADDPTQMAALLGVAPADEPTWVTPGLLLGPGGVPEPSGAVVVDTSHVSPPSRAAGRPGAVVAVLRGPCYLSLRSLLAWDQPADGIVLLAEPGRARTDRDVTDATGIPVLATVPVTATAARTIDAGLLPARHATLREFSQLRRWLTRHLAGLDSADPRTNARCTTTPQDHGTDLPLAVAEAEAARQRRRLRRRWRRCG